MNNKEKFCTDTIKTPLDIATIPLEEYLNENSINMDFLCEKEIKRPSNVNCNGPRKRLVEIKDTYALVTISNNNIQLILKLAGAPVQSANVKHINNNRTGELNDDWYEMLIKKSNSNKVKLAKFTKDKIYDPKQFKAETGCLCNFNEAEILAFLMKESKKASKIINEYRNTGKINFGKYDWLWGNAVCLNGKLYQDVDEYGNIRIDTKNYIRAEKRIRRNNPMLYMKSDVSISDIIIKLVNNIFESWNEAIEVFLAIGVAVITPFSDEFWNNEGFPTILFVGTTEAGKSEICSLIAGIFGCDKSFFSASRTTTVGMEQTLNAYNCIPQVIDDISRYKLMGDKFIDLIKQISNGIQNNKGKNGQESGVLPPCATMILSSNIIPTEKPEIFNRILYVDTENLQFNPDIFAYFSKAKEELSCILPHILTFRPDEIKNMHANHKRTLKNKFGDNSDRMFSQIAIALTGLEVLSKIANKKLNIPYEKLPAYVKSCQKRFKSMKNPLEKLLEAFPILIWEGRITEHNQYQINYENEDLLYNFENVESNEPERVVLSFNKVALCKAYNKYFATDKSEEIDSRTLKGLPSPYYKILTYNKSVNLGAKNRAHGFRLDITNHPLVNEIRNGKYTPTNYVISKK